jgi:hypothetical protein
MLRCRLADRLDDNVAAMLALPARAPDTDHRRVVRVPDDRSTPRVNLLKWLRSSAGTAS